MEFPQICPFWVNGQCGPDLAQNYEISASALSIFVETLQYDTAQ